MRIIITEITEMHEGNYCLAGWEAQTQRMVRALPNGNNWTAGLLQKHEIGPGATFDMNANGQQHRSAYPHKTEDTPVDQATIHLVNATPINWLGTNAPPSHATVGGAFGGHLQHTGFWNGAWKGVHVAEAVQIGSLSAVTIPVDRIELFEDDYQGKTRLRAYIDDGDACYNLPVVARNLREGYRLHRVDGARRTLPANGRVHVRLGLARAWAGQPGKCSLMINGING